MAHRAEIRRQRPGDAERHDRRQIDVTKFPAPQWHAHDGGRYIGTGCYIIMRDPDDGWINFGTYRVMMHDAKSLGFTSRPASTAG